MLAILHTQTYAHTLICMHTCLREAPDYDMGTRAKLITCSLFFTPGLKSQIWCFISSICFSLSLFCKTVSFKNSKKSSCPGLIEALRSLQKDLPKAMSLLSHHKSPQRLQLSRCILGLLILHGLYYPHYHLLLFKSYSFTSILYVFIHTHAFDFSANFFCKAYH